MRTPSALLLSLALLAPGALAVPGAALARDGDDRCFGGSFDVCNVHAPAAWGHRHDVRHARIQILNHDRSVSLLLTDDVVAFQLSDRAMRKVDRELERAREEDEDGFVLATVFKGAVLGGVRSLLDHSLECPLDELRDVRIRDGQLEFLDRDGRRVFDGIREDGEPLLASFSDADQRAFVDAFHHRRDRWR